MRRRSRGGWSCRRHWAGSSGALGGVSAFGHGLVVASPARPRQPELGLLLGRAKGNNTRHAYINADGGYVSETWEDGQDVLAGNWPKITTLVTSLFADPQLRAENATVQVRNGQHTTGLAALYTAVLQADGFNTVAPRDADVNTYQHSVVIVNQDHPGADYTARKLAQLLQAPLSYRHIGADHAQIVAILGADVAEGS